MDDTRKQIIELIEPYMSKELSEGCILDVDKCNFYDGTWWVYRTKIIEYKWELWVFYILKNEADWEEYQEFFSLEEIEWYWYKILWHYDITAVLKYIHNCKWAFDVMYWESGNIIITHYTNWRKQYDFPWKPLHLYTQKEETNLLTLLQELWK